MYEDRNYLKDEYNDESVYQYINKMRTDDIRKYIPNTNKNNNDYPNLESMISSDKNLKYIYDSNSFILSVDGLLYNLESQIIKKTRDIVYFTKKSNSNYPKLEEIIAKDSNLKYIYDDNSFILSIDGVDYKLESQIIKKTRDVVYFTTKSVIKVYMKKKLILEDCDYPENNSLYIILLSGNLVTYGDEGRTKQRHISTKQIYKGVLDNTKSDMDDYYIYDISNFIKEFSLEYSDTNENNLFFTTSALRDYHYLKQKNNAYYHIQAINLPFQNIEFYYIDREL